MSQNFTIDDTDPTLIWGPGWGVESPNDAALDNYFESTYHASQTSGANVSLAFSGVAISLFGSKGPDHGNFSVRFDSFIQLFSAKAETLSYRQLLFSTNFPAGNHSITLTNTDQNQSWLDLDFLTVTGPGNTPVPSGFSSTISPPSVTPTTTHVSSAFPLAPSTVQASSQSKPNGLTLVLAIVFGILLFFLVVAVAWYLIRRAHRRRGTPPRDPYGAGTVANSELVPPLGIAFSGPQTTVSPVSHYPSTFDASGLGSSTTLYTNHSSQQSGNSAPVPPVPAARPWSPFSVPIGRMFGAPKEGADSMKSTFLKV